ncbi:hypothetical protein C8R46DRAFT_1213302 [Mycena filopes]|nr:hypothetical protein C8R46DRAFT_1213302 [Mycena filopes]
MPGQLTLNPRKAGASLRIVVVGGSLAGLATAYTLQRAGHNVTILERTDGSARSHGGIRSPPNMTRVLNQWGLGPALAKVAVKCKQFIFHQPGGEMLGLVQLHEDFLVDLMADFVFIQHGELHSMLLGLATREGVEIRYNCPVECVDTTDVSVLLADGERLHADFVVGADGPNSVVRTAVMGEQVTGYKDGHLSLTMAIPTDLMRDDEDLRVLTEEGNWWVWLGPSTLIHGSLVNLPSSSACKAFPSETLEQYDETWDQTFPIEHFGIDFSTYDIRVQKLMKLARKVTPTVHIRRPLLDSSVCHLARIVIVGEAAHPLVPAGQHNAGLTMEDADTLGALFSRIQHRSQLSRMLVGFEEIRQPRCHYAQNWELRKRIMMSAPEGPQAEEAGRGDSEDGSWGDEMEMFSHSSTEAVEDWWTKWGSLLARDTDTGKVEGLPMTPTVEVNVSSGQQRSTFVY